MDERVTELEIRLTHYEDDIEQLDKVIIDQQKLIDNLGLRVEALESKLKSVTENNIKNPEEEVPPPHY